MGGHAVTREPPNFVARGQTQRWLAGLVLLCSMGGGWGVQADDQGSVERHAPLGLQLQERGEKPADAGVGAEGMIKIPVSSKISVASWPRADVPDYMFTVHSFGGQKLGINLNEFDWTLQVESRRALLSVESFRSDGDVPGQPLGLFRLLVDDQQLRDFYLLVIGAKLGELRPAMKTHPGYTERVYTLIRSHQDPIQQRINNSDEETNSSIAALRYKINSMLAGSFEHPERAVQLGLKQLRSPSGDLFEVTVTNIGSERVCFTDPRWVLPAGPVQRAVVMVTPFPETKPGDAPPSLAWREIPLEPLNPRPEREPLVVLDSGAVWKTTTPAWKRVSGARYLAYFSLADYVGEPMVDGVYRIRGRVDSPRLVIEQ
jgi:hypothetical protein